MAENTPHITVQVGADMYEALSVIADRRNLSIHRVVLAALEKYFCDMKEINSERKELHAALDRLLDKSNPTIVEELIKEHIAKSLGTV